ncbi:hypothetical protein FA13DRAFT_162674 [Coprinellus micaceus]|uniref:Uncharacterized protein n=1 Tax=Coprinellus micaceus TaxID=71717 RepID=A0A4Y7TJD2_COPMI|nr:hypothetical protein FA13DRAFT_162674 [Coprinellus micaceus]
MHIYSFDYRRPRRCPLRRMHGQGLESSGRREQDSSSKGRVLQVYYGTTTSLNSPSVHFISTLGKSIHWAPRRAQLKPYLYATTEENGIVSAPVRQAKLGTIPGLIIARDTSEDETEKVYTKEVVKFYVVRQENAKNLPKRSVVHSKFLPTHRREQACGPEEDLGVSPVSVAAPIGVRAASHSRTNTDTAFNG